VRGSCAVERLDEPEPLATKLHVRRKLAAPGEVICVRLPPPGERPVALALVMGEPFVDVSEPPPREFNGFYDRARPPLAVIDDPALADLDPFKPSLAAQQVAVFFPASTSASSSFASSGVSPKAKLSRSDILLSGSVIARNLRA